MLRQPVHRCHGVPHAGILEPPLLQQLPCYIQHQAPEAEWKHGAMNAGAGRALQRAYALLDQRPIIVRPTPGKARPLQHPGPMSCATAHRTGRISWHGACGLCPRGHLSSSSIASCASVPLF